MIFPVTGPRNLFPLVGQDSMELISEVTLSLFVSVFMYVSVDTYLSTYISTYPVVVGLFFTPFPLSEQHLLYAQL